MRRCERCQRFDRRLYVLVGTRPEYCLACTIDTHYAVTLNLEWAKPQRKRKPPPDRNIRRGRNTDTIPGTESPVIMRHGLAKKSGWLTMQLSDFAFAPQPPGLAFWTATIGYTTWIFGQVAPGPETPVVQGAGLIAAIAGTLAVIIKTAGEFAVRYLAYKEAQLEAGKLREENLRLKAELAKTDNRPEIRRRPRRDQYED